MRKAIEAVAKVFYETECGRPGGYETSTFKHQWDRAATEALTAALPHILEALAEQAESERYEWAHAWLRGKAEAARD